jgi:hypothetical protein
MSVLFADVAEYSEILFFAIIYPCCIHVSELGVISVQVSVPAVTGVHVSEEVDDAVHMSEPADIGVHVSKPGITTFHPELKPTKELNGASENALIPNIY